MSETQEQILNLDDFRSPGVRVFSGRDRGFLIRIAAKLDEADTAGVNVLVKIPRDTYSIDSGFFLALFGPSIRSLGREEFCQRYRFETQSENLRESIQRFIGYALRKSGQSF